MRGKKSIVCLSLLVAVLFLQGCLYDITSIVVPDSTTTGMVITFDVNVTVSGSDGSTSGGGIVLQIPEGTSVLRMHYNASGVQGDLTENPDITSGYYPEPGYHLYGGVAPANGSSPITLKVWLAVPVGVSPGTYKIKAAIGDYSGSWTPQSPQVGGVPVTDFSQIAGKYASNELVITTGAADTTPPADVTPMITDNYSFDLSSYDEAAQGDVALYRVYSAKSSFTTTADRQLLDATTTPSVVFHNFSGYQFSDEIGDGLYYFEIPPGAEYPFDISGLFSNNYYFAVTSVDLSGNESSPVVIPMLTGSITGTVMSGSVGIPNVWVTVDDVNCFYKGSANSDADGNFSVAGLPAGDYKVYVAASDVFLEQWYNGRADCDSADTVSVIAPDETTVNVVLAKGGSISGTVTNGTSGFAYAWVTLYDGNCSFLRNTNTDQDGNYSMGGLSSGDYKVCVSSYDVYLGQCYNGKADCSTADTVPVAAPDDATVNVVLAKGGSISGTVTKGASGFANAWVAVYDENCSSLAGTYADANGNYSVAGLPSGDYKVYVAASNDGYLEQWYSGKADCSTADRVSVTAPDDTTANVVLEQGGRISGTVTNGTSGIAVVWVQLFAANCSSIWSAFTDSGGNYSFIGLKSGSYKVHFTAPSFSGYLGEWNSDKTDCNTADTITVTAPNETTVNAVLSQGGRISGTITDGTSGISGVMVTIYDANCDRAGGSSTDSNGHYSVIGLQSGSYKIYFRETIGDLTEWYNGKSDCETADTILVTAPQEVTIDLTMPRFRALNVSRDGTGMGSVSSNPSGINCGNTCYNTFAAESTIYLTASAAPGSVFVNWRGACLGNTNPCKVDMNGDKWMTANFDSIADFTAIPTSGDAPLFVSFNDESKYNPSSWSWSFGDGTHSNLQSPVHNYASPGYYTVSLNITTGSGSYSITKNSYIDVFSCWNQPARSGIYSYIPYSTIQAAYNTATDGEIVEAQAKTFSENLNFMNNTSVMFRGGFDCGYATNEDQYTTVHGKVTITDGAVTVENLVIK